MKILHIGNEMSWRGGENQVRLLIEGLKKQNIHCAVAYPEKSRGYARFKEICEVLPLPSRSAYDPRSVFRLVKFCRKNEIDVIDAQSSGGMSLALAVKSWLPTIGLVVHRRVDNAIKTNCVTRRKYLNKNVDQYVCISNAIGKILKNYGVPENKIAIVRSAVEPEKYEKLNKTECREKLLKNLKLATEMEVNGQTILLGNASALTSQKGYETLIQSCKIIKDNKINFHCLIAGDGVLEKSLKELVSKLALNTHVTFLGHIANVSEFLSALDVLVVPSNNEGLGTILLEGAFAGCALVGTRVGGIPEIIFHNETGLSVDAGDIRALAHELSRVIENTELRVNLANQARRHVLKNFSLENMVLGNLEIYKKLLKI